MVQKSLEYFWNVHFYKKNANDMRCYQVILDMYFYLFISMNKPFSIEACIKQDRLLTMRTDAYIWKANFQAFSKNAVDISISKNDNIKQRQFQSRGNYQTRDEIWKPFAKIVIV